MKQNEIKVVRVEPGKTPEVCLIKNDLRSLQEAVSIGADHVGLIEIVSLDVGECLLLNEEGKLIGLQPNRRLGKDILCGVFYIAGENEHGVLTSLSEESTEYYMEYFKEIPNISPDEVESTIMAEFISFEEGLF